MTTNAMDGRSEFNLPNLEDIELVEVKSSSPTPPPSSNLRNSRVSSSGRQSQNRDLYGDLDQGEVSSARSSPTPRSAASSQNNSMSDEDQTELARKRALITAIAWTSLLVAVLAWSIMGPSFVYLNRKGIPPILAACWRNQCVLFFIFLPMLYQLSQTSQEQRKRWLLPFVTIREIDAARAAMGLPSGSATAPTLSAKSKKPETLPETLNWNVEELRPDNGLTDVVSAQENGMMQRDVPEGSSTSPVPSVGAIAPNHHDMKGDTNLPQDQTAFRQEIHIAATRIGGKTTGDYSEFDEGVLSSESVFSSWSVFKARVSYHYNVTLDCPIMYTILSGICWTMSLTLWVVSLKYTSTTLASLFASMSPVVLVGWLKLKKKPVSQMEIAGVAISLCGVAFCVLSGLIAGGKEDGEGESHRVATGMVGNLIGALLNILSSFALAGSTIVGARSRSEVPLFVHSMIATSIIAILQMMLAAAVEGATFSGFATTLPDGTPVEPHMMALFGWAQHDVVRIIMLLAFVGGWIGLVGFNLAILYVPPLAYTVLQLLDPPLTGFISYAIGTEPLPKWPVYVGAVILLGGIFVLVYGEDRRTKAEKAHEKLMLEEEKAATAEDAHATKAHSDLDVEHESADSSEIVRTSLPQLGQATDRQDGKYHKIEA